MQCSRPLQEVLTARRSCSYTLGYSFWLLFVKPNKFAQTPLQYKNQLFCHQLAWCLSLQGLLWLLDMFFFKFMEAQGLVFIWWYLRLAQLPVPHFGHFLLKHLLIFSRSPLFLQNFFRNSKELAKCVVMYDSSQSISFGDRVNNCPPESLQKLCYNYKLKPAIFSFRPCESHRKFLRSRNALPKMFLTLRCCF